MRPLPFNFGKLSNTSVQDYDSDGLLDVKKINFEASYKNGYSLIYFEEDGTVTLPTYNECLIFFKDEKFYVEKGLERFLSSEEYLTFDGDSTFIIPIKSDSTSVDGDGDGILDKVDCRALKTDILPDKFIMSINQGLMQHNLVIKGYQDLFVEYKGTISDTLFCSITGKSMNINPKYSLYAIKDSDGSYVYYFSSEELTDKELEKKYYDIKYVLIMKYMVNKLKEKTAHDGTISIGGVGSISVGGVINFSGQISFSSDSKENMGIQLTGTSGVGGPASIGVGGSAGVSISITDAPDIEKLEGFSTTIGGSIASPNGGIGGDIILFNDDEGNSYAGLSASLLAGASTEVHVNINETVPVQIAQWNVYDIFNSKSDDLLNTLTDQDE